MKQKHTREALAFVEPEMRIVCVADTHSRPHGDLARHIGAIAPQHILHAGDIGSDAVLRDLERLAPVIAVRGNIDDLGEPDFVTIGIDALLKILLTHIAVNGPRIRPDVLALAKREDASLVVCGHSHVPFANHDRGVTIFNPGSAGPRRFQLPILFGVIRVRRDGVALEHIDCQTGKKWLPTSARI